MNHTGDRTGPSARGGEGRGQSNVARRLAINTASDWIVMRADVLSWGGHLFVKGPEKVRPIHLVTGPAPIINSDRHPIFAARVQVAPNLVHGKVAGSRPENRRGERARGQVWHKRTTARFLHKASLAGG